MNKIESLLLQKLSKKASRLKWGGWIRRTHWSWTDSFKDEVPYKHDICVIGLSTVLSSSLLQVEIRLFYPVPYLGFEEFNLRKHPFTLELKIIDHLNRFNSKCLLNIYSEEESEEKTMLMKIFERARERTIFFDRKDLKRKAISLKKVFGLI